MAEIELAPLSKRLDEDELGTLRQLLEDHGADYPVDEDNDSQTVGRRLKDNAVEELLDLLEAHDIAAEVYLPVEFDGRLSVGDIRVASAHTLGEVLEDLENELGVVDEEPHASESYEEEDEVEVSFGALEEHEDADEDLGQREVATICRILGEGLAASLEKNSPLHIVL